MVGNRGPARLVTTRARGRLAPLSRRFGVLTTVAVHACLASSIATGRAGAQSPGPVSCNATAAVPPPALTWQGAVVRWSEWPIRLGERGIPVRLVIVTFDPARLRLTLDIARDEGTLAPWSIDLSPADARVALNAGQFSDDGPWGWVVHRGREWQAPGTGTLAGALIVDTSGAVRIIPAADISSWRSSGAVLEAVQSYPTLLEGGGRLPAALCRGASGVDLTHRDARLAIGVRRDGHVVIAMSRYDGTALPDRLPIGPTTPEMADLMRRLGALHAVMLDGGLSAQLLVRTRADGPSRRWPGLRSVPLALVGREITTSSATVPVVPPTPSRYGSGSPTSSGSSTGRAITARARAAYGTGTSTK